MAANYKLVNIAGWKKFYLPTVDDIQEIGDDGQPITGSRAPEWMIKMDDDLTSTIEDFTDYSELYGWYGKTSRFTTGDLGNRLFTSATLRHTDLTFQIPNGGYNPNIETKMNTGVEYESIEIVRLGNIKATRVKLQEIKFGLCRIKSMAQELDRLVIVAIVTRKENTIFVYDNDGMNTGQTVSTVDYSKNTAE